MVRWMVRADGSAVSGIREECHFPTVLNDMISSPDFIFKVAESEGLVSGFIAYKNGRRKIRIVELAVEPSSRRRGVAQELLQSVLSKAIETSKEVEAFVPDDNLGMHMLLKKCGLVASGIHERDGSSYYKFSIKAAETTR